MLSRQEFEKIFECIIFELYAIFEGQSARPLAPKLREQLIDQLNLVQEDELDEERVAAAFSIINQYIESSWSKTVDDCYQLYLARSRNGK